MNRWREAASRSLAIYGAGIFLLSLLSTSFYLPSTLLLLSIYIYTFSHPPISSLPPHTPTRTRAPTRVTTTPTPQSEAVALTPGGPKRHPRVWAEIRRLQQAHPNPVVLEWSPPCQANIRPDRPPPASLFDRDFQAHGPRQLHYDEEDAGEA